MPNSGLPLFGTLAVWTALAALVASMTCYLAASARRGALDGGASWARAGRAAFLLAVAGVLGASATLGTLLVTHRFDVQYVYDHSARAMSPLYYFPSFWAGQEGSFLLWGFWISVLGIVLAWTSGSAERRVMPIYASVLLFLVGMVTIRSPFLPTVDQFGIQATPTEGLGLNPNLENYWMVIHPPTLFLGFAALTVPFAFALAALFWRGDLAAVNDGWLRRALPWGLFSFAVLGLAMMMGGYWAYEMLGWGGFWEWDPVENGPFVPWMGILGFLHAAQIQRVRGGFSKPTLLFALLPLSGAMYETFLTRTGVLDKFSVHSFSTLGGAANNVLLGALLVAVFVSIGTLLWRAKAIPKGETTTEDIQSREFGFTMAVVILTLCGLIAALGLSAPLLTGLGVKLHIADFQGAVREDYHNKALFPIAVLLALGMGLGPHLAWRSCSQSLDSRANGRGGPDGGKLVWSYGLSVLAAAAFVVASKYLHTPLTRAQLIPQLLLFTASIFAVISNLLLLRRLFPSKAGVRGASPWTVGGVLSHVGAAVLLLGVVCLVTFVHKQSDILLVQNRPAPALFGAYTAIYRGMSGNPETDRDNALLVDVASTDGKERFKARLPFALRATEGGQKMIFAHPAILHHGASDLYLNMSNGTSLEEFYKTPVWKPVMKLGDVKQVNISQDALHPKVYTVEFMRFDNPMGASVRATGQMPDVFPVSAVVRVTYNGVTSLVKPQFIQYRDGSTSKSPDVRLPGGALLSFAGMNAGSTDQANPGAGAMNESAALNLREDSGPPALAFYLEVTTRPMINLVWVGTLLLVLGGLVSMRRRILENRLVPIPDLAPPAHPNKTPNAGGARKSVASRLTPPELGVGGRPRRRSKPAPSLSAGKGGRR